MGSFSIASHNTEAAILARLIHSQDDELTRGAAEYLLSIHFCDEDIARMNDLSELARQGSLSPSDAAELDGYLHVSNLLAVMQSKARRSLRRQD